MRSTTYKQYLVIVLMLIYAFNFMDRMAFGLLLQEIKNDLSFSDTQLGFLTGIASAFFYAVMGIPIARWADRGNRVAIIAIMAALQAVAVAMLGLAGSFLQLLLIRIAVSVGEAGCVPPAHSLIADHFPRTERPRAVARYKLGTPLALVIGFFAAGWLNELYGWRTTFVFLSLPGFALAVIAWFTLYEPRRRSSTMTGEGASSERPQSPSVNPGFKEICVTLWANVAFRHLLFAFSAWMFFANGLTAWQAAFFIRSYGLTTGELGTLFALVNGLAGLLGTYFGGELAARYAPENERRQLLICAAAFVLASVIGTYTFFAPNHYLAFGALGITTFCVAMTLGPIFSSIQTLVPSRMRAMSIALVFLVGNLIGMGFGPLAVGAVSDSLLPLYGKESLRYALALMCPGFLWAAWHLWRASRTVARDIVAVQSRGV